MMTPTPYKELSKEELQKLYETCKGQYDQYKASGLSLDMSRGKPGKDQLDLSEGLESMQGYKSDDGTDCRNYGGIDGIPEMKNLFAEIMEVRQNEILVGANASLTLMYESIIAMVGVKGTSPLAGCGAAPHGPKRKFLCPAPHGPKRKFLCPAPGYDRHFSITEYLGFEMVSVAMTPDGPDMAEVRKYVADPSVAGIWCVPVFSNPQGIVYSDEVIKEMAALKPAADDFRILWDNAYIVHSFEGEPPKTANLLRECEKQGSYDMALMFTSFSKISYPGAAVCAMAASPANLNRMRDHLIIQYIGPDKMNQLRHVRFFKDAAGVRAHMRKHADVLRPKFDAVLEALSARLGGKEIGSWLTPRGGYFVSFDAIPGCAARTIALCAEAGLIMTAAGAAYPYGRDPHDSNIRIAPTFPSASQLKQAMELFCTAVELAALEKLLAEA